MKLLMISGDRSVLAGKHGPFVTTLEGLAKEFERIDVITPMAKPEAQSAKGSSSFEFRDLRFPNVFFHPSPRGLWYQCTWAFRTGLKLIRTHHHDVMTVHEYPPFYNGSAAWLLYRWTGIPYAIEIHHIVGWPKAANTTEAIWRFWSRLFLPIEAWGARKIRVVNSTMKDLLVRWWISSKKIEIVPSFYLDRAKLELARGDPHLDPTLHVMAAGRLVANKGFSDLIRALALLPSVHLLICGEGPERSHLLKLIEQLGLQKRIALAQWMGTQLELWHIISGMKIFVMPSKSEGGPRIALEAMAVGTAVISTKVGVMSDVIKDGENGLFTSGTPADIAAKVRTLLRDESLRVHIAKNAPKILDIFDGEKLLHDYAQFLKSLAK